MLGAAIAVIEHADIIIPSKLTFTSAVSSHVNIVATPIQWHSLLGGLIHGMRRYSNGKRLKKNLVVYDVIDSAIGSQYGFSVCIFTRIYINISTYYRSRRQASRRMAPPTCAYASMYTDGQVNSRNYYHTYFSQKFQRTYFVPQLCAMVPKNVIKMDCAKNSYVVTYDNASIAPNGIALLTAVNATDMFTKQAASYCQKNTNLSRQQTFTMYNQTSLYTIPAATRGENEQSEEICMQKLVC